MKRRITILAHSFPIWLGVLGFASLLLMGGAGAAAWALAPEPALATAQDGEEDRLLEDILPQTSNFDHPNGPKFIGAFATETPAADSDFVAVSYNLRYGEAVTETIRAFREVDPLPAADIIMLQEMDEDGVAKIARELDFNYVYYPASVAGDGDNFGNAILSRWPITDPTKLILPGLHPLTGQQRTATRAIVHLGEVEILVYSTHIEVVTAPPAYREAQFEAILADIPTTASHVIVGGDFNTITARGVDALAELYADSGLAHASAGLGPTFTRFGMRPAATDHLFSRGFTLGDAGVLDGITASDHFPVWGRFSIP